MTDYHIYGRPFAGSLIAEFLFTAADCPYTISFPDETERKTAQFLAKNPTGRIPVLVCPEGHSMFDHSLLFTISPNGLTGSHQPLLVQKETVI